MLSLIGLTLLSSSAPAAEPPTMPPLPQEAPAEPPRNEWNGSVNLGASLSSGNTEKTTVSAGANAEYRREKDRTTLKFLWAYQDEGDAGVTERQIFGSAKYDYFLSEKTYAFGQLTGEYNFSADLDLRTTASVGVGRQILDGPEWWFAPEVGLAYVDEDFVDDDDDSEFLAARLAYKGKWQASEAFTLEQDAEVFPSLEDSDDVYSKVDTRAKVVLTASMFAQAQHVWTWDNTPADGAEKSDQLFVIGVGWNF